MPGRKKVSRSRRAAASPSTRARKKSSASKKKVTKKKAAKKTAKKKVVRKKPTKAERKATHSTRRKPTTNRTEIKDYFQREDTQLTPKVEQELKMVFCRAYARHGIVSDGLSAAGISRKTYYRWRKNDESFSENCVMAEEMANDFLEREARRRAMEGFDRPVIYKGEITETYKDYSDSLMTVLLKGNRPDKFKERSEVKHGGKIGRPMELEQEDKESIVSSILGMITSKPDPDGGPE